MPFGSEGTVGVRKALRRGTWWERDLRGSRKRGLGNKEKGDQWGERVSAARSRRTELSA